MTKRFFIGLAAIALALGLAPAPHAQPSDIYENQGIVIVPSTANPYVPAVDALNFANDSGALWEIGTFQPWQPTDTINFTNKGLMVLSPGLDFQTYPADIGLARRAGTFANFANGPSNGVIDASGLSLSLLSSSNFFVGLIGNSTITVNATNIINSGEIDMNSSSLMKFNGEDVDMSYGTLSMASPVQFVLLPNGFFSSSFLFNSGILDGYWAANNDTNTYNSLFLLNGITEFHEVTNRNYQVFFTDIFLTQPLTYQQQTVFDPSNVLTQIVFFQNADPTITNSVFFDPTEITVQWEWLTTNFITGAINTNFLFVNDNFGEVTNIGVLVNGVIRPTRPTYKPRNYTFVQGFDFSTFGIPPAPISSITDLIPTTVTNTYAAYQAILTAGGALVTDVPGGDVTNQAGRIEINAEHTLNLTGSQITSLNYLLLSATNHFIGSSNAQIVSPNLDLYLRSTNGLLSISNIVLPSIPFPDGPIDLWSTRWTNVVTNIVTGGFVTNRFHVLFAKSLFTETTTPFVQTLQLSVTNTVPSSRNLVISDILNVTRNVKINTKSLTISTNAPGSITPAGELNILSDSIIWPTSAPNLQFFTNFGSFTASNSVFFGGSHTQPSYPFTITNLPYQAFINHGLVSDGGSLIWSLYFENEGIFSAPLGSIALQQNEVAYLTNGSFFAFSGDISVTSANVLVSNHVFQAGGSINLSVSNILSDGVPNLASLPPASQLTTTVTNGNQWRSGAGLALRVKSTQGDLLGTTITCSGQTNAQVPMIWAGEDRGLNVYSDNSGFFNDDALGRLILDGVDKTTRFVFSGPDNNATYALYVDSLELRDATATTQGPNGDWTGVQLGNNIKVYYAQALANGQSIAEKLNGRNGGRFIWVSNYNYGYFSSTNIVYGNGTTYRVNAALAQSCTIVSHPPDGHPNCTSLTPIFPIPTWTPSGTDVPLLPTVTFTDPPVGNPGGGPAGNPSDPANPLALGFPPAPQPSTPLANAFIVAAGTYNGLFADTNGVALYSSGYFSAVTTTRGTYTARLSLGGHNYSLSGHFDPSTGLATNTVRLVSGLSLNVQLQLDLSGGDQILGWVSQGNNWSAALLADRQVYAKSRSLAPASYTFVIPPDANSANSPLGFGFGTVKIDAAGNVRWSGTLADGTKVSQSSAISKTGFWPLYASLYSGSGSAISWIQATNGTLAGRVVWLKATSPGAKLYSGGFTNSVDANGASYTPSASGQRVLQLNGGNGALIFNGGGLAAPVTNHLSLDLRNHVTTQDKLSLAITPSSGLFRGTALDPASGKKFNFQGVLSQPDNAGEGAGYGFFIGNNLGGEVELMPEP